MMEHKWRQRSVNVAFLMVMGVFFLVAVQGTAAPLDRVLGPYGQEEFYAASAANFVSGAGFLALGGQLGTLFAKPDDWCQAATPLGQLRPRYEIFMPALSPPIMVYIGTLRHGINGDWGLAGLLGWEGANMGNQLVCALDKIVNNPLLKAVLTLVIPPVTAAAFGVYGFNSHVNLGKAKGR